MFTASTCESFSAPSENHHTEQEISEEEVVQKYQLDDCIKWIINNKYERTCLQLPEELLNDGTHIALYLQKILGKVVYILGNTNFGSCCVDEIAAEHVNADSVIHFGHACLSPVGKLPVFYVFLKENFNIFDFCSQLNKLLDGATHIIVFYDDIYHHFYSDLVRVFNDKENICISRLCICQKNFENKLSKNEQILCGRIFSSKLGLSTLGVYIGKSNSPTLENLVLSLPEFKWCLYDEKGNSELINFHLNRSRFLQKRMALIEKVKEANTIGILIGTLGIKNYLNAIERIKFLIKKNGKKYYQLAVGKPSVSKLANFLEIDIFVCISCQENSLLKDCSDYYKPIVTLFEIEMAFGNRSYGQSYTFDFKELLPGGLFYEDHDFETEAHKTSKKTDDKDAETRELAERNPGTIIESPGAQFLLNRTWHGLEDNDGTTEIHKAVKGRSGIPQIYENEVATLSTEKPLV